MTTLTVADADMYSTHADKIRDVWKFFKTKEERYDEACVFYKKACAIYKTHNLIQKAIDVNEKCIPLYEYLDMPYQITSTFCDLAKLYKTVDSRKSEQYYAKAINMNIENERFFEAGQLCKELATLLESHANSTDKFDRMMSIYSQAVKMYLACDRYNFAIEATQKGADVCIEKRKIDEALKIMEELLNAKSVTLTNIKSMYSLIGYLQMLLLCDLSINNVNSTIAKFNRYRDLFPKFCSTAEEEFVKTIISAVSSNDVDSFINVVKEKDSRKRLENSMVIVLNTIKSKYFVEFSDVKSENSAVFDIDPNDLT